MTPQEYYGWQVGNVLRDNNTKTRCLVLVVGCHIFECILHI